jgi:hypothetical protein
MPELMAALCHGARGTKPLGCHEKYDRYLDPDLRDRLGWKAFERLCLRFTLPDVRLQGERPIDAVRRVIRGLESAGVSPLVVSI